MKRSQRAKPRTMLGEFHQATVNRRERVYISESEIMTTPQKVVKS